MRNERKILHFIPQKLRKSFANGNPSFLYQFETNKGCSNNLENLNDKYYSNIIQVRKNRLCIYAVFV